LSAASSADAVNYYVYYRVLPTHAAAAKTALALILAQLEERTGVTGRLLQRQNEPLLWMEIYEGVRDGRAFERALEELLVAANFAALLAPGSARKIERFVAAAP
jgi:hypothetical protein